MVHFDKQVRFGFILWLLILTSSTLQGQEPCSCTNCPVPIVDEMTHQGFLDVLVNGPDDLGECPLQEVCFTITHTWVGDLSVTLTSPSGLNYLVMADLDNSIGGCGNNSDNIDVCITVGTGNPLTNNTDYVCNGPPFACLNGNWTMPCGGVTDPFTGAVQAPNCDLNDFNVPGDPANGTWTLTVNDICLFNVGFLVDWSLVFECGVVACVDCEADGGFLPGDALSACEGDSLLIPDIVPEYPGAAPDTSEYGYTFLIVQNDLVVDVDSIPDLTGAPPGVYQICGLSYLLIFADSLPGLVGLDYSDLQVSLPICGDLSDNCLDVEVYEIPPPTLIDVVLCDGDCFTLPDGSLCCDEGLCEYILPSVNGCDSLVQATISILPPNTVSVTETVCEDGCVTIDGVDYCAPGPYTIVIQAFNGCDSTIQLSLIENIVTAQVQEPDTLNCFNQTITLDGTASQGSIYSWTDESGGVVGTDPTLDLSAGGCYALTVSEVLNGVSCAQSDTVCVVDLIAFPVPPLFIDPEDALCPGTVATYTVVSDTSVIDYLWTLPPNANLLDGGDGQDFVTVNWTSEGLDSICVTAVNNCGNSPVVCQPVLIFTLPTASAIIGPDSVCVGGIVNFCVPPNVNITDFLWTVPAGVTITTGQGTECIEVDWGNAGSGSVCVTASNPCGSASPFCVTVTSTAAPQSPIINGVDSVCLGGIVNFTLQADVNTSGYEWDIPAGMNVVGGGDGLPFVTASIVGLVTDPICASALSNCGVSADTCATLVVTPLPAPPVIQGSDTLCPGEEATFCVAMDTVANEYTWLVPPGANLIGGQGTNCLTLSWDAPGLDTVCIVLSNQCGSTNTACFPLEVLASPDPISIVGADLFCAGDSAQYVLTGGANAQDFNWILPPCATLLQDNGTDTIVVLWSELCAQELLQANVSNSCSSVSADLAIEVLAFPQPDAGADASVCGLDAVLQATPSIGQGNWTLESGPGTANLSTPNQAQSAVTVSELGMYTFIWTEDNQGCAATDTVSLEFVMPLAIQDSLVNEFCDLASGTYFITFTIVGGQPPYNVDGTIGGTLNGNEFTSGPIPGDVPYLFTIDDGGFCEPVEVTGLNDCQCTTLAGTMGADTVTACADALLVVPFMFDGNLNPEDVLQFVLHDYEGPDSLGTIFGIADNPEFFLTPPMETGVVYYVSAVAGDSLLTGELDFDDVCLSIAQGTPVLFLELPTAALPGGDGVICEGETFPVVIALTGNGPFELTFGGVVYPNYNDGDTIFVSPLSNTSYELTEVSDANGCGTTISGASVTVTVNSPVSAQIQASASVCNTNGPNDITVLNFNTLIQGGDDSGSWVDLDGSGASGTLPVLNFFNTQPGVYTFAYTTGAAQAPCQNETYLVEVTVENCTCPGIDLSQDPEACNLQSSFPLNSLLQTVVNGSWTLLDAPADPNAATLTGSQLQTGGAAPGLYTLLFVLSDPPPPPGCPDSSEVVLELFPSSNAGTAGANLEFCEGEGGVLNLFDQLNGFGAGGAWTEVSAQPSTGNAFNAAAATFSPGTQLPGNYRFRYTVTGQGPCPDDSEEVVVIVQANPDADAGPDQQLTCTVPELMLGGPGTSSGNFIVYDWSTSSAMVSNPQLASPSTQSSGLYVLTVTNSSTGCFASDTALITAAQDVPQPEFEFGDVGCFGSADGFISIVDISGGMPPYLISFEGGAFSDTTLYDGLSGGTYSFLIEDASGCGQQVEIDLTEPAAPSIILSALSGSTSIVLGEAVELQAEVNLGGPQIATTSWVSSVTGLLPCTDCLIVIDSPRITTTYVFTVIDEDGCISTAEIQVEVDRDRTPFVPNIFSPNGDGNNDLFTIYAGPEVSKINYLRIFDRWGETVFDAIDFPPNVDALGWDGTHRGQLLNPAVFVWMAELELVDGRKVLYTGDVTLVR